jgi:hypothetical protein
MRGQRHVLHGVRLSFRAEEVEWPEVNYVECAIILAVKSEANEALAANVFALRFEVDRSIAEVDVP